MKSRITIEAPDWELLQKQKTWLLCFEPFDEEDPDEDALADAEKAAGLLHFIDHIQDSAVEQGIATEIEVFGFSTN